MADTLTTRFTADVLPEREGLKHARAVQEMFRVYLLAEQIALLARNVLPTPVEPLMDRAINPHSPIELSDLDGLRLGLDYDLLHTESERRSADTIIHTTLPRLTARGVVAVNMVALDDDALARGDLVPQLREPFHEIPVLKHKPDPMARAS